MIEPRDLAGGILLAGLIWWAIRWGLEAAATAQIKFPGALIFLAGVAGAVWVLYPVAMTLKESIEAAMN